MSRLPRALSVSRLAVAASVVAALWACNENLPTGPDTFTVSMVVSAWSDTVVVGDSKTTLVKTTDPQNREIQGLHYSFKFADSTIASFTQDASNTNAAVVTALKAGATTATISLPDTRFTVPAVTKNLKAVVSAIAILSAHDTTLTAVNDTAKAVAASQVKSGGASVYRAGQGLKWVHKGTNVTVVGAADTIRYIAKSAGVDTLIASHDYCLAGARCADTLYARVVQTLKLTLSSKTFTAWTLGDTAGPSVVLADRRGTGNAQASVRLVPVTAADSARVTITSALGTTNATTGAMAAPKLVSAGNGIARVAVVGINPDGTKADSDTITYSIRQIAARAAVEPLAIQMTDLDTVPVKAVARDVRGYAIGDATVTATPSAGLDLTGGRLTVTTPATTFSGTLTVSVTGSSLASANPGAPATTLVLDATAVSVTPANTYSADALNRTQNISLLLKTSGGNPLANQWVRFVARGGIVSADSVLSDATGAVTMTWTPSTTAGRQVLTGFARPAGVIGAIADSSGLIVLRRSVVITAGAPVTAMSTASIRTANMRAADTASVIVRVKDAVGNLVTSTVPTDVGLIVTGGFLGATTCDGGVCTALYTATTVPGGSVNAQLGGVDVSGSPIAIAITAGLPDHMVFAAAPAGDPITHNTSFATQPVINIVDVYGNICTADAFTIQVTRIAQVAGVATTLTGDGSSAPSVNGVVTFAGLGFGGTAGTITIRFSVLAGATSLDPLDANVVNP
jgi:hypothetical protein